MDDFDELLLVSDQGQLIRVPVAQVRVAGRNTQGVIVFRTTENEHVVSVERLEGRGRRRGAGGRAPEDEMPEESA